MILGQLILYYNKVEDKPKYEKAKGNLLSEYFNFTNPKLEKLPYIDYLQKILAEEKMVNYKESPAIYEIYLKELNKNYFDVFYSSAFNEVHGKNAEFFMNASISPYYKMVMYKPSENQDKPVKNTL